MLEIIDSHSHLGLGLNSSLATINDYKFLKSTLGISFSLLMPQPILDTNISRDELTFDKINEMVFNEILQNRDETFSFVPLISPIYTSPKRLEEYIQYYNPLALKVHMRSDNSNPDLFNDALIKIIKKYDIPLIVHTDYSKMNNTKKDILKNLNSALNWMRFFQKEGIKGYLTHGARLNKIVLKEINNMSNILIGIGPDLLLQNNSFNGLEQEGNYLKILYDNVDNSKLAFDIDYNWNIDLKGNLDLNSIKRLEQYWNNEQLKMILCENSKRLFNIKERNR